MQEKLKIFYIGPEPSLKEMSATIYSVISKDRANLTNVVCLLFSKPNLLDRVFTALCRFCLHQLGYVGAYVVSVLIKNDLIHIVHAQPNGRAFRSGYDYCLVVASDEIPDNVDYAEWDVDYIKHMTEEFRVEWIHGHPVRIEDLDD